MRRNSAMSSISTGETAGFKYCGTQWVTAYSFAQDLGPRYTIRFRFGGHGTSSQVLGAECDHAQVNSLTCHGMCPLENSLITAAKTRGHDAKQQAKSEDTSSDLQDQARATTP